MDIELMTTMEIAEELHKRPISFILGWYEASDNTEVLTNNPNFARLVSRYIEEEGVDDE